MSHRRLLISVLFVAAIAVPGYAQESHPAALAAPAKAVEPKAPAKPSSAKPAKSAQQPVTMTPYGDWALRCRAGGGAGATRVCEISQTIEAQDQSGPIAKISIGRPTPSDALHVIVVLPNNVSFPSSVHIMTDETDKWGLELDWKRCIPGGCFAETTLADATVAHWHGLNTEGRIVFIDAAGDQIALPIAFHGMGEALDALNK
jgi:invasion protein IalB